MLIEEFVVYPLALSPKLPDIWDMSWGLRAAYVGPEVLACLAAGAVMRSWRGVLLFGLASSAIRAALYVVQRMRGAEGYLRHEEPLYVVLPIMLVGMAVVYAGLAAIGRGRAARQLSRRRRS